MPARVGIDRQQVCEMYRNGVSSQDIANVVGVSQRTVCYHLKQAGMTDGRWGGKIARTIPEIEIAGRNQEERRVEREKQEMAAKNAANACLVVEDRTYSLKGVVGSYEVSTKEKVVIANLGDSVIELNTDSLNTLADEFRALARNLVGAEVCNEMW